MDWIKKHPHLLVLILVALAVTAASGLLVKNAQEFDRKFDVVRQPPAKGTKYYQQEQTALQDAASEFQNPVVWKKAGSLFVSIPYMVADNQLKEPTEGTLPDTLTGMPIPYKWFFDHKLSPFLKGVGRQDPDGDGFWTEDEWRASTDPNDAKSHPPYHTKLFVAKYIKVPFLLRFQSVDGDPVKDKPEALKFQINTLSVRSPTAFLGIGEMVPNTKFKIDKFEYKMAKTPNDTDVDVSELTLIHMETGTPVVLVMNKITDSPDSYARFRYLWPDPFKPKEFDVKKLQPFGLMPEKDLRYKLLDIDDTKALIETPTGEKIEIGKLPPNYP